MIGWYSQKFPPGGASAAEGIRNQLGQPKLNPLTVLVREAAQNSWDARAGEGPVRFSLALTDLPAGVAPVWRRLLLGQDAPSKAHLPLRTTLDRQRLRILTISDRGTRGLGGPTRADNAIVDNNDFVSFVRNVGEPRNTDFGGGTYGFGKGIFYRLSRCGTVVIHTRCQGVNGRETRLIACSLWQSYTVGEGMSGQRYTGRHWWGDVSGEIIEPLVGEQAESVAKQLRLTAFADDETGTSITIIDPDLDMDPEDPDSDAESAAEWMADAIAWNLWPKMLKNESRGTTAMEFAVTLNGSDVKIPDPTTSRPLSTFVHAYRALSGPDGTPIASARPKQHLGTLAVQPSISPPFEPSAVAEECGFDGTTHHICLLRTPELVVKYLAGPKTGNRIVGYSGVFRAADEIDDVFANAEPPTHDDWVSTHLDVPQRTYVNVALKRLKDAAGKQVGELQPGTDGQSSTAALGSASILLSDLVLGVGARPAARTSTLAERVGMTNRGPNGSAGAPDFSESSSNSSDDRSSDRSETSTNSNESPGKRSHRRTRKPRIEYHGAPSYLYLNGEPVLSQEFAVEHRVPVTVGAILEIAISGGREKRSEAPAGAPVPQVRGWCRLDGSDFTGTPTLAHPGDGSVWTLLVRPAVDTTTEITLTAAQAEDADA